MPAKFTATAIGVGNTIPAITQTAVIGRGISTLPMYIRKITRITSHLLGIDATAASNSARRSSTSSYADETSFICIRKVNTKSATAKISSTHAKIFRSFLRVSSLSVKSVPPKNYYCIVIDYI